MNSLVDKSAGNFLKSLFEKPNIMFIQDLRKNVGPNKYKKINRNKAARGNKSRKKEKNNISETKNIEPGKPKNIKILSKTTKNNFGHKKFKPLISVINLVLNLLAKASTNKNELVEIRAWLINIQKLANIKFDWPLIIQAVNQCISTTVEYATNFFKSIW